MKTAICLFHKNQNEILLEWVQYHLFIGFDHVIIYDNESDVSPSLTLQKYRDFITVIPWEGKYKGRQCVSHDHCIDNFNYYDWIAFIDTDEYIVLLEDSNNIKDYLLQFLDCPALALYWLGFNSCGHISKQLSVIESYVTTLPKNFDNDYYSQHYKCIVQPKLVSRRKSLNGSVHHFDADTFNVHKQKCYRVADTRNPKYVIDKCMRINHYALMSHEDYIEKVVRGGGNGKVFSQPNFFRTANRCRETNFDLYNFYKKYKESIVK
jgi:hypothetical protein